MTTRKYTPAILTLLFLSVVMSAGQADVPEEKHFTSLEGLYSVSLPEYMSISSIGRLDPTFSDGLGKGYSIRWINMTLNPPMPIDNRIMLWSEYVYFNNEKSAPQAAEREKLLRDAVERVKAAYTANSATIMLYQRETIKGGLKVKDLAFQGAKAQVVLRFLATDKRIIRLQAVITSDELKDTVNNFFDSIKIPSYAEAIDAKEKEATPKPLPPCEDLSAIVSDIDQQGLKGKIRSVSGETERIRDGQKVRSISGRSYFDPTGYLTKQILFDHEERPHSVSVYGCIDGKRVVRYGYTYYDDREFGLGPIAGSSKGRDMRYHRSYEAKLGAEKHIDQIATYGNDGALISLSKYQYSDSVVEVIATNGKGVVISETKHRLGPRKGVTESVESKFNSDQRGSRTTYKVQEFDGAGNWIKRTVVYEVLDKGKVENSSSFVELRTITYYK